MIIINVDSFNFEKEWVFGKCFLEMLKKSFFFGGVIVKKK